MLEALWSVENWVVLRSIGVYSIPQHSGFRALARPFNQRYMVGYV